MSNGAWRGIRSKRFVSNDRYHCSSTFRTLWVWRINNYNIPGSDLYSGMLSTMLVGSNDNYLNLIFITDKKVNLLLVCDETEENINFVSLSLSLLILHIIVCGLFHYAFSLLWEKNADIKNIRPITKRMHLTFPLPIKIIKTIKYYMRFITSSLSL